MKYSEARTAQETFEAKATELSIVADHYHGLGPEVARLEKEKADALEYAKSLEQARLDAGINDDGFKVPKATETDTDCIRQFATWP